MRLWRDREFASLTWLRALKSAWLLPAAVAAAPPFGAMLIVVEKNMAMACPDSYRRTLFPFGSVRNCSLARKPLTNTDNDSIITGTLPGGFLQLLRWI